MPYYIGVGGNWKLCEKAHIGVGGLWKEIQKMHIGVGGVWKEFYTYLSATLNAASYLHIAVTPADATSGVKVDSDGTIYELKGSTYTARYTWLTGSGVNSDYECRWTNTSGVISSGNAGVWQTCGSDQGFNRNNTNNTPSTETCTGTLEIRMAASPNTVLASASITLEATVDN